MGTSIVDLPDEVLISIFTLLRRLYPVPGNAKYQRERQPDLAAFMRVSIVSRPRHENA